MSNPAPFYFRERATGLIFCLDSTPGQQHPVTAMLHDIGTCSVMWVWHDAKKPGDFDDGSKFEKLPTCPECGGPAEPGEFVDIGVGMQKCSPDHCEDCGWVEGEELGE